MTFFHSRLDSKPSGGKNLSFHESDVDVISDLIQKTEQVCDILCYFLIADGRLMQFFVILWAVPIIGIMMRAQLIYFIY